MRGRFIVFAARTARNSPDHGKRNRKKAGSFDKNASRALLAFRTYDAFRALWTIHVFFEFHILRFVKHFALLSTYYRFSAALLSIFYAFHFVMTGRPL